MAFLWLLIVLFSILFALLIGKPDSIMHGISDAADSAVKLCINLCGIFAIWSGILEVARRGGVLSKLTKLLQPIIRYIFKDAKSDDAMEAIASNISANILGMGNAATPAGQRAISELNKNNVNKTKATSDMVMLLILNNSALTIVPTTVLTLRAAAGSVDPGIILPYALVSSAASTVIAIIMGMIFK